MVRLKDKVKDLPLSPGCYMFLDSRGDVLYVGKSKSLRKRTASYFSGENEQKINVMLHSAAEIVYETTETDIEALLLEYQLIKTHQPPYNARMKKDQQAWYLNMGLNEPLPSLTISREPLCLEGFSFGPFTSENSAEHVLETIGRHWQLPTCRQAKFSTKKYCLRMHMKSCHAPCRNLWSKQYPEALKKAVSFLLGQTQAVIAEINGKMQASVDAHEYEQAAKHLKRLTALTHVSKQMASIPPPANGKLIVHIESHHEEGGMLFYLEDSHALAWKRTAEDEELNIKGFMAFIRQPGNLKEADEKSLILGRAVMEIDARRKYFEPERSPH